MRIRTLALALLALALLASVVGNVALYGAYSASNIRLALLEGEATRVADVARRERARATEREAQLEALRRELATRSAPAATTATPPTATPGPAETPVVGAVDPAVLKAIETRVTELRGLQPRREVALSQLDRDALRQFLADSFNQDYSPLEREVDQRRFEALGLLQPGQDVTRLQIDLLTQQVIGLYDPDTKRMYLIGASSGLTPSDKVTYAHEFTHALQDQHFDLNVLAPNHPDNLDRNLAVHGLIEGDAVLTMQAWALDALSREELRQLSEQENTAGLDQAPLVLREELLFPYTSGFEFVSRLHRQGGFAAVDAAFRDPPASTEQVLHPEKYHAREQPLPVSLPDIAPSLGPPWRELAENVMGELDLRILIQQYLDRSTAQRAAAGWGGDRFAVLTDGARTALALRTLWDSAAEAHEFFDAYTRSLDERFGPGATTLEDTPSQHLVVGPDFTVSVQLADVEVLILVAPDEGTTRRLRASFQG